MFLRVGCPGRQGPQATPDGARTATHDALTGLLNRRAFLEIGASEAVRSKRYKHPMCFVFLDLDDFKQLNDSKGHDAGDAALRATGKVLLNALRANDYVARMGGR